MRWKKKIHSMTSFWMQIILITIYKTLKNVFFNPTILSSLLLKVLSFVVVLNILKVLCIGVLESEWVQYEMEHAFKNNKNIILVLDERVGFPTFESIEPFIKKEERKPIIEQVMKFVAIKYIREKQFREVSIQSIMNKLEKWENVLAGNLNVPFLK